MRDLNIYTWKAALSESMPLSRSTYSVTQWIIEWVLLESGIDCGLILPSHQHILPCFLTLFVSEVEKVKSSWLHLPDFDCLQHANMEGEAWSTFIMGMVSTRWKKGRRGPWPKEHLNKHSLSLTMTSKLSTCQHLEPQCLETHYRKRPEAHFHSSGPLPPLCVYL